MEKLFAARVWRGVAGLLTVGLLMSTAQAQADKPVRILVGFAPGGSADTTARLLSERVAGELKQNVLVENRSGARGACGQLSVWFVGGQQPPRQNRRRPGGQVQGQPQRSQLRQPRAGQPAAFFGVMLATSAGLDLVHVPFNGGGPLMTALVGNQVACGIDTLVDQIELVRAGKTRLLATAGSPRSPLLPDVPTFAEAGFKGD